MLNVYVDLRIAYIYINRAYLSNEIFFKKFGRHRLSFLSEYRKLLL